MSYFLHVSSKQSLEKRLLLKKNKEHTKLPIFPFMKKTKVILGKNMFMVQKVKIFAF